MEFFLRTFSQAAFRLTSFGQHFRGLVGDPFSGYMESLLKSLMRLIMTAITPPSLPVCPQGHQVPLQRLRTSLISLVGLLTSLRSPRSLTNRIQRLPLQRPLHRRPRLIQKVKESASHRSQKQQPKHRCLRKKRLKHHVSFSLLAHALGITARTSMTPTTLTQIPKLVPKRRLSPTFLQKPSAACAIRASTFGNAQGDRAANYAPDPGCASNVGNGLSGCKKVAKSALFGKSLGTRMLALTTATLTAPSVPMPSAGRFPR